MRSLSSKQYPQWRKKVRAVLCGMGVVEVVIGAAIVTLVLSFSIAAVNHFFIIGKKNADRVAATYLAQEGVEAARFMRDASWASIETLPVDTPRYLDITSSAISITATPEVIGAFERTVFIHDVYRANAGDDIVPSTSAVGKTLDPETKLVEVVVSAPTSGIEVTLGAYLTNLWGE